MEYAMMYQLFYIFYKKVHLVILPGKPNQPKIIAIFKVRTKNLIIFLLNRYIKQGNVYICLPNISCTTPHNLQLLCNLNGGFLSGLTPDTYTLQKSLRFLWINPLCACASKQTDPVIQHNTDK